MKASPKHSIFSTGTLFVFLALLAVTSCKSSTDSIDQDIELNLIEAKTELPSKVRLFFKVDVNDDTGIFNLEPDNFEIYEDNNKVSTLESQAQIMRESGDFMYSSILMLDLSGSILNNSDLPNLKEAAKNFVKATMPGEEESMYGTREMAIYWFDGEADVHSLEFFTSNQDSLIASIESIDKNISSDVSTNLNGAVVKGLSLMESRLQEIRQDSDIATAGSMVLFTDGTDQAGRVDIQEAYDSISTATKEHSIFTIGLGGEIDEDVLSAFGTSGFELAEGSLQLNDTFLAVAERLESESNSYYVLDYCSPKRAGEHTLELRAVYEDKFGSFETSFSAEGFAGGCSIE